MGANEVGPTVELTHSGYFDWAGMYKMLASWANENQLKIFEPLYKDKTNGEGFTERELEWSMQKKVDRLNSYIMTVAIKMWDCQEVEVTQNNQVSKLQRGRIRIRIVGLIDQDFQGVFQGSKAKEVAFNLYQKITKWDWNFSHWDYWYNKQYELQEKFKAVLNTDTA